MIHQLLPFSTSSIKAVYLKTTAEYEFCQNSILINLSNSRLEPKNNFFKSIQPWNSLLVQDHWIGNPGSVVSIEVNKSINLADECSRWKKYNELDQEYPAGIPLFISPQYSIGSRLIYPEERFPGSDEHTTEPVNEYMPGSRHNNKGLPVDIKLNLWYAPAGTHCVIHRVHPFLELHTQIYGIGHMQKFKDNDLSTLFEDVIMKPGYTHEPFFKMKDDHHWEYPWHQYYSETDCLWMAIEFHPLINYIE